MVTNVAFLAALTVFLFGAWLAGELTFLARFKGLLFRRHGLAIAAGALLVFFNLVRRLLRRRAVAVPPRHRPEAAAPGPATRHAGRGVGRPERTARIVRMRTYGPRPRPSRRWTRAAGTATGRGAEPRLASDARRVDPREVVARDLRPAARPVARTRPRRTAARIDLRGSEVRTLATVGAFRVVPTEDLREATGRRSDARTGRPLPAPRRRVSCAPSPTASGRDRTTLVVLTERGRDVLESHRRPADGRAAGLLRRARQATRGAPRQPRLSRLPAARPTGCVSEGATIRRVVLDYELKRDYQRFLQQRNRTVETPTAARAGAPERVGRLGPRPRPAR